MHHSGQVKQMRWMWDWGVLKVLRELTISIGPPTGFGVVGVGVVGVGRSWDPAALAVENPL